MSDSDGKVTIEVIADNKKALKTIQETKETYKKGGADIEKDFSANLKDVEKSFESLGEEANDSMDKINSGGNESSDKLNKVMTGATVAIGAAFAAMAAVAVAALVQISKESLKLFVSYDDALREMQTEIDMSTAEGVADFEQLKDAIREVGVTTKFTASEAADAMNILVSAGYSAADSVYMLNEAAKMATITKMSLADTVNLLDNSITVLGLDASQTGGFIDKLAKASLDGKASMSELSESLEGVGTLMSSANQDIDKMTAAFALLSNENIKGAEAAGTMKNLIIGLQKPTTEAADSLKKLGVSVYNTDGTMRDVLDIITDLNTATADLDAKSKDDIFNNLFSKRDVVAVQGLMRQIDKDSGQLYTNLVENSEGAAAAMAETLEGGVGGLIRSFKGMAEEMKLTIGEPLADIMNDILPIVKEAFSEIMTAVKGFFEAFTPEQMEALKNAIGYIVEYAKIAILHLINIATVIIPLLADGFVLIMRLISPILDIGLKIFKLLSVGIVEAYKLVASAVRLWWKQVNDLYTVVKPALTFVYDMLNVILDEMTKIYDVGKSVLSALGYEFKETETSISGVTEEIQNVKNELTALDGTTANVTVNTNYSSSGGGGGGGGFSGGGGGGGSGSGSGEVIYAGTGFGYDARSGNYINAKTGTEVSASTISSRNDLAKLKHLHTGGIVEGREGQEVPIMALGGEMVLTKDDQREIFKGTGKSVVGGGSNGLMSNVEDVVNRMQNALLAAFEMANINVSVNNVLELDGETLARNIRKPLNKENSRFGRT